MAVGQADGSIILSAEVDTSGVKKSLDNMEKDASKAARNIAEEFAQMDKRTKSSVAQSLAWVYKNKRGVNQSVAQSTAWADLKKGTVSLEDYLKALKRTEEQSGETATATGNLGSAFGSLSAIAGKLVIALASVFSVQKLIDFSREASHTAIATEASVQRVIDIYGEASEAVGDFIDNAAIGLGLSKSSAVEFAAVYGNLFSVWADSATNAALTNRYLQMTAVLSSKTGRSMTDVQERIRSGLLGNTEAIEDLGVFVNVKTIEMTEAFQKVADGRSWEQLNAYEQQQVRTLAILEQATAKYGDEVADTAAIIDAEYTAAWEDFEATWGQVVNKVILPAKQAAADLLQTATTWLQFCFNLSNSILGSTKGNAESIKNSADNQKQLTDEVENTNSALKKTVAGFDDLQILSGGASPPAAPDEAPPDTNGMSAGSAFAEAYKIGFEKAVEKYSPYLREKLANIVEAKGETKQNVDSIQKNWDDFLNGVLTSDEGTDFISEVLGFFGIGVYNYEELGALVGRDFTGGIDTILKENKEPLSEAIKETLVPVTRMIEDTNEAWSLMWDEVIKLYEEDVKPIVDEVFGGISGVITEISNAWKEYIVPVIDDFSKKYEGVIQEHVLPAMGKFRDLLEKVLEKLLPIIQRFEPFARAIIRWIGPGIQNVLYKISDAFTYSAGWAADFSGAVFDAFGGILDYLDGLLTGDWEKVWGGLSTIAQSVIDIMPNVWKDAINKMIDDLNTLISLLNEVKFDIPDWDIFGDYRGKQFGINLPSIPKLAQGAVIPPNREFLAVLGDQTSGTNIETPLSTMVQAFQMALDSRGDAVREDHYYLSEKELMRVVYKLAKGGEKLNGNSLVGGAV